MSAIRKIPLNKFSCIRKALVCMWNVMIKVAAANQIDVVFDSYIKNSIKELTRASHSNDVKPVEYMNLLLESSTSRARKILSMGRKQGGAADFIT